MNDPAHRTSAQWRAALSGLVLAVTDSLLARACAGCGQPFDPGARPDGWCEPCLAAITCRAPRCPRCALEGVTTPCERCSAEPPPFGRTLLIGSYAPPLDRIVRAFKFRRDPALGRAFAAALASQVGRACATAPATADAPLIAAIPLSEPRLAERGYNQSLLIAHPLARLCGLTLAPRVLCRARPGPAQSSLATGARLRNVEQAFIARHPVNRPVLLIDDVMTTGATLGAASRALIAAGAPSVTCVVVARTPAPDVSRRTGPS